MDNKKHSGIISLTNAQRVKRACSVILPLCFLSLFIALFAAFSANDIYAFVKSQRSAQIHMSAKDTLYEKAKLLEANGIINDPALFSLYVRSKNHSDTISSFEGEIQLDSSMSYREIIKEFSKTTE